MFRIGICDDEDSSIRYLKNCCEAIMEIHKIEYEVVSLKDGQAALDYDGDMIDILFLDIEMGETSGLALKKSITAKTNINRIVYNTSHTEAVYDAFGVKVVGFLVKPADIKLVEKYINLVLEENKYNYLVKIEGKYKAIEVRQGKINCIESRHNDLIVYIDESEEKICAAIDGVSVEEETSLVRCHRSFIVNLEKIKKVDKLEIVLINDMVIPIGRKYRDKFMDKYDNYMMKVLGGRV